MTRQFTDCVAVVEYLLSRGSSLDDAVKAAEPPLYFVQPLLEVFGRSFEIQDPALLTDPSRFRLCTPLGDEIQQPYSSALTGFLLNERRWSRAVVEGLASTSQRLVCQLPLPGQ